MNIYLRWKRVKEERSMEDVVTVRDVASDQLFKLQQCFSYSQPTADNPNWCDVGYEM